MLSLFLFMHRSVAKPSLKHEIQAIQMQPQWFMFCFVLNGAFDVRVPQDKVASESLPLQGFTVKLTERPEGEESSSVFHLYHKKTLYYTFRADDQHTARRSGMEIFLFLIYMSRYVALISTQSCFPLQKKSSEGFIIFLFTTGEL